MATILLAAAGGAIGSAIGGSVLGLGAAVIGRAVGGTIGNIIDQGLLGGSAPVEHGRVDTLRVQGASEGRPMAQVYGAMRVGGQVIWASRFKENVAVSGGKGLGGPKVRDYSYSVSVAIALCEGEITRIGRVWADGKRLDMSEINWRLHVGDESQMADPAIVAVEGDAPAYRGVAYVVFEDLNLTQFGNRVPQFNFEVIRARVDSVADQVKAVALIPGSGEYALATDAVHYPEGKGANRSANVNNEAGGTDLAVSLDQMAGDLPNCESVSLVVSWFGDDLRCGSCAIAPKVEQAVVDGTPMAWQVSGAGRASVPIMSRDAEDRPNFGGTPCDESVLQSIAAIKAQGKAVMFYPFVLMDIPAGNGLPDPYGGAEQAVFPWRGRISASVAPGGGTAFGIGVGASGAWAGHDGEVAVQANGGWVFMVPKLGWRGWDEATAEAVTYDGVDWQSDAVVVSAGGAGTHWRVAEIDHVILAGADSTTVNVIPNGAQVIGVTGRVTSAISGTGILSWQLGVAGSLNRYGSGLGLGLNSWAKGLSGQPQTYYADTPLLLTPDAGTLASGTVRLCVHYVELSVPRAV